MSIPNNLSNRTEHFLARCKARHGDRFDYSRFVYIDAKTKGIIICPDHGSFEQTPDKHLSCRPKECPKCWEAIRFTLPRKPPSSTKACMTKEKFLERAKERYGDRYVYDLSTFEGLTKNKITITCPVHGSFSTLPQNHLLSNFVTGCPSCGYEQRDRTKTRSFEAFIEEAKTIHKDRYLYPTPAEGAFRTRRSKVVIQCVKHGSFEMTAQKHLSGQRCWECAVDDMIEADVLTGGYNENLFADRPELKELSAFLYYLKINDGELYKIGITRVPIDSRIKGLKCKAEGYIKQIELIDYAEAPLYEAFVAEQYILTHWKADRKILSWSTELFGRDIYPEINTF